jgi:DNA-binding response OmpR family regulator
MRLLAVEDETELSELVKANLGRHGFAVDLAATLADAQACLKTTSYDVILLDLQLPDGDGIELLRTVRGAGETTPVIALTARDTIADRVIGLNEGADDYLVKPFALDELVARIHAVVRRMTGAKAVVLRLGNLAFSPATQEVSVGTTSLQVPRRELATLEVLMRAGGRVVTRDRLIDELYGHGEEPASNAVDSHISRLRKRLGEAGSDVAIQVIRGVGYVMKARVPQASREGPGS